MARKKKWKLTDPLYRGDSDNSIAPPDPTAKTTIVEHILYLGGPGRPTPFLSVTEERDCAEHFAERGGHVWRTTVPDAVQAGATHIPLTRLMADLKDFGRGAAKWDDPSEVAHARVLAERWREHLLDWRDVSSSAIQTAIDLAFEK